MFAFIKRLLGYPTEAEKTVAQKSAEAPYKVEPAPAPQSAPEVEQPKVFVDGHGDVREVVQSPAPAVNPQITDAVTQTAPAAKTAKKKPANKKPAGEKKSSTKKPGRKPKSAKA